MKFSGFWEKEDLKKRRDNSGGFETHVGAMIFHIIIESTTVIAAKIIDRKW